MIRRAAKAVVVLSLLAFGLVALTQLASGASFNPISTSCLDDPATTGTPCDGDYSAGGDGNLANVFKISVPDSNFSLVVTFTPPGWCVATMAADCSSVDSGNNPTGGSTPVLGGKSGTYTSTETLALQTANSISNSPCNNVIPVSFNFYVSRTSSPGPVLNVIGGQVDVNNDGAINGSDNGSEVSGRTVTAGLFDINGANGGPNGTTGEAGVGPSDPAGDNGRVEHNLPVIASKVDLNGDAAINAGTTGSSGNTSTSTTLTDPSAPFTAGALVGAGVVITGGTGAGQERKVTANATDTLTVDPAWTTTPDNTSTYNVGFDTGTIDAGLVSGDPIQIPSDPLKILSNDPDGDSLPNFVDHYPAYNLDILDPNAVQTVGDGDIIYPRLRSAGTTTVFGTTMIRQFLIFDKGALTALNAGPPYNGFTAGKGYPSLTIRQDPTAGTAANPNPPGNNAIADFCSPLTATTTTLGTTTAGLGGVGSGIHLGRNALSDGGIPPCTSSAACGLSIGGVGNTGTHILPVFARSQRDADNDGIENGLDTCPFTVNLDSDPRVTNGPDNDGLDSACDPSPSVQNLDQDGDGWANRLDNCPVVANADQRDANEVSASLFPADGGPASDGIGDACDAGTIPDGASRSATVKNAICNGTADSDLNNTSVKQPDGWCDAEETYLGTLSSGPGSACPVSTASAAWPPDFNNDRVVNVTDRTQMSLQIKNGFNAATNQRFDLNRDGTINVVDRTIEINLIGMTCTP